MSANLPSLGLRLSYRTGRDDMVGDFFVPCLKVSETYRRSAGYFTSAGLALAARGIASLASRQGRMQLVVSPHLQADDIAALNAAKENPEAMLRAVVSRELAEIEDILVKDRLNALAWLAAAGLLEVRLALRLTGEGRLGRGLYHEKVGIFSDSDGNHVAFSGSSNETAGGLIENFESIDVYCSWHDSEARIAEKIENFEALWNNTTPGLQVIDFSEASRELLEYYRDPDQKPPGLSFSPSVRENDCLKFEPPPGFELRDYQAEAIRAWSKNGGRGVLAMATGTGKTFTALTLASKVAERNSPLVIIVVCPFLNLCKQWIREMAMFGLRPLACYDGKTRWLPQFEEGYQKLALGMSQVHAMVTTNKTFQSDTFQSNLRPHVCERRSNSGTGVGLKPVRFWLV